MERHGGGLGEAGGLDHPVPSDAQEQPARRGQQVVPGPCGDLLVDLAAPLPGGEHRQGAGALVVRGALDGVGGEGLAAVGGGHRAPQLVLAEEPGEDEGQQDDRDGVQEDVRDGGGVRAQHGRPQVGGELPDGPGVGGQPSRVDARWQRLPGERARQLSGQPVGEDGPEDGHAERGADGPEERRAGGGDPEVPVGDGVLGDQDEHLHHQAEPGAEDEEVRAHQPGRAVLVELVEEQESAGREGGPEDREDLPAAGPADDLAGAGRGDQQAEHHRQHVHAGHRRGDVVDHLEEGRQVGHRAEHGEADDEADHGDEAEGPDPEQLQRQYGFGRAPFDGDEGRQQDGGEHGETDDLRGAPAPGRTAEGGDEDQAGRDGRDEEGAEVVDDVLLAADRDVQDGRDDDERDDADRQVDVEHPAPAEVLGEEPAEEGAQHARDAEDGAEEALVLSALARGDQVADDRHRQHHEAAAAQPLERPEADELRHVLGDPAEGRADQEDHDRGLEELLAAVLVAELAPERGRGRGGQQIGGHHPRQVVEPAQLADDRRERRGDDGLVEGREQHAEEQGSDRHEDAPAGLPLTGGGGRGWRAQLLGHGRRLLDPFAPCGPPDPPDQLDALVRRCAGQLFR